jgi:hypothetical protein
LPFPLPFLLFSVVSFVVPVISSYRYRNLWRHRKDLTVLTPPSRKGQCKSIVTMRFNTAIMSPWS